MVKRSITLSLIFGICFLLLLFFYNKKPVSNYNDFNEIKIKLEDSEVLDSSTINSAFESGYKIEKYVFQLPEIATRTHEARILDIAEQTVYHNTIYYKVIHGIPMSNDADAVDVYTLNRINGDIQLIYQTDSSFGIGYLNEFRCNEQYLFWVHLYDSGWKIYKMNLASRQPVIIRECQFKPGTIMPSLSVSNEYVSWYEKHEQDDTFDLMLYSISEDEILVVSSNCLLKSPYKRAHIRESTLTYLTQNESGIQIEIYDLNTLKKQYLILPKDCQIENVYSNGNITVWHENYKTSSIFIYDHQEEKLYSTEEYVFSIDLIGQNIFVNTGEEILAYNIQNKSKYFLTRPETDQRYIMATVTSDQKYIAYNQISNDTVETLIIEP